MEKHTASQAIISDLYQQHARFPGEGEGKGESSSIVKWKEKRLRTPAHKTAVPPILLILLHLKKAFGLKVNSVLFHQKDT